MIGTGERSRTDDTRDLSSRAAGRAAARRAARNGSSRRRPRARAGGPTISPPTAREAAALILLYPGEHGLVVSAHGAPRRSAASSGTDQPARRRARSRRRSGRRARSARRTKKSASIPRDVRIIGALSPLWVVVSNFVVRPFVGVADHRPEFRASPREVSALIETPVAWVRDPSRVGSDQRVRDGVFVKYPVLRLRRPPRLGRDGDGAGGVARGARQGTTGDDR